MTKSTLIRFLIGKSILETVLVATIAVGFHINAFPPYFHGWGEATATTIAGWAVNNNAPSERVSVQLFVDGTFVAAQSANLARPDVPAAGWAEDEWHGYSFALPALGAGTHEARVYALHESGSGTRLTLQQLGDPIRFSLDASGRLIDLAKPHP
ncbi:MAG TPA: hypothetical protein VIG25_00340 [Pyrinomonadaceae bacterium]|jgi:hypothetical protein